MGLALTTLLPTPTGWTSVYDLKVDDWLIDEAGIPCQVTELGAPEELVCYKLKIGWGEKARPEPEEIIISTEHLVAAFNRRRIRKMKEFYTDDVNAISPEVDIPLDWMDFTMANLSNRTATGSKATKRVSVIPASEAREHLLHVEKRTRGNSSYLNWHIPITFTLRLPERALPIEPYVLGLIIYQWNPEAERFKTYKKWFPHYHKAFAEAGLDLQAPEGENIGAGFPFKNLHCEVPGLTATLEEMKYEGIIPMQYLRGSVEQRRSLLSGMADQSRARFAMESWTAKDGRASLHSKTDEGRARVRELVRSLGYLAVRAKAREPAFTHWITDDPTFRIKHHQRKYNWDSNIGHPMMKRFWKIYDIEDYGTELVRTIKVDSKFGLFTVSELFVPMRGE